MEIWCTALSFSNSTINWLLEEAAVVASAAEGVSASSSRSWSPSLWTANREPLGDRASQPLPQMGLLQASLHSLRRRRGGVRWEHPGFPRPGGEGTGKAQEGLGGRRKGKLGCGLWSCRIGPGSGGIPGHELRCSATATAVACGFSSIGRRCSSLGASGSRSGWEWWKRKRRRSQLSCCCLCWCWYSQSWSCPFLELNPWIDLLLSPSISH